jgi:hypothetical protein
MSKHNKTEEQTQEVAVMPPTAGDVVVFDQYLEDSGLGFETMGAGDLATPFMGVLQKGSPQCDDATPKYVEGARQGMLFNTLTGKMYDGKVGVEVIPCGYRKMVIEWTARDQGGGFIAQHDPEADIVKEASMVNGHLTARNGHWLVDTAYYFVLFRDPAEDVWQHCIISMQSTQMKKSRKWNSIMSGLQLKVNRNGKVVSFNPPMFSHVYRMKTVGESNEKGTWYGWDISVIGPVQDSDIYKKAKDFHSKVASGEVQAGAPPKDDVDDTKEGKGSDVPF